MLIYYMPMVTSCILCGCIPLLAVWTLLICGQHQEKTAFLSFPSAANDPGSSEHSFYSKIPLITPQDQVLGHTTDLLATSSIVITDKGWPHFPTTG